MHFIFRLLLFVFALTIVAHCQGGGGRGGSRSSRSGTSRSHRGASTCTDDKCRRQNMIKDYISMGGIFFIIAVAFYLKWSNGRPAQSIVTYVNSSAALVDEQHLNQFESGIWSSRYYQYNKWHGPYLISLSFNSEAFTVGGSGLDDIGAYTIEGLYSGKTNRIGLTKTYQKGTGDPTQNLGHDATIQLSWNTSQSLFEGKWFVNTSKYSGNDKFELKLERTFTDME